MLRKLLFILILLWPIALFAQEYPLPESDTTDLSGLSLQQLLKLKSKYKATELEQTIGQAIDAASRNPQAMRRSPSIISVITREDIVKSGSTTFADVLRMIPGVEYNVDVTGVVAISFRGLWANEGNLLLMIDGQECNETAYNSVQIGNHYPINQIKRIEFIRGPGSAIYGGNAEYAVINIITETSRDLKGLEANVLDGQSADGYSKQNINVAYGNAGKDYNYSVSGMYGRAQAGTSDYRDVYGNAYSMTGNSGTSTQYLNAGASYKNFSIRAIYDNYQMAMRDGYIATLSKTYPCDFKTFMSELKYKKVFTARLSLVAKVSYKRSAPWENTEPISAADSGNYSYYKVITDRVRTNLNVNYNFTKWLSANAGFETMYDYGRKFNGDMFKYDNSDQVRYRNYAPFAQLLIISPIANVTVGGRYDISNAFGSSFNPRVGVTKKVGIVNFKLLYASSFRAPSIEDIQYSMDKIKIVPEKSHTVEFEAGIKPNKNSYISANVFDITTYHSIKYYVRQDSVMSGDPDGYRNSDRITGSQGFEVEYKYKAAFGNINASYSYYTVHNKGVDSSNIVSSNRNVLLGTAQHKFSLFASFNVGKYIYISPSAQFLGRRYGINGVDTEGNGLLHEYPSQLILNLSMSTSFFRNLIFSAGVNNITNQQVLYIQAYNSLHAPLPGLGTEYYLSVKYNMHVRKEKKEKNE